LDKDYISQMKQGKTSLLNWLEKNIDWLIIKKNTTGLQ
jgi:hypothetical protein